VVGISNESCEKLFIARGLMLLDPRRHTRADLDMAKEKRHLSKAITLE